MDGTARRLVGDDYASRNGHPSERARTNYYGFDHRNRARIALARVLWLQGFADQARRLADETVREASSLENPVTRCIALIWRLSVVVWSGDFDESEATISELAECAEVNAFGPYIVASGGMRGALSIRQGRPAGAVGSIEESLARLHAARYELLTTSFEIMLTHGLRLSGRHKEALDVISATIHRCRANGELLSMSELLRSKAAVLRATSDATPETVERLLLDALSCSREQGARGYELRAAIDLARLLLDSDRVDDAAAVLNPVRQAFSEGFDTLDLRAADALLGALAVARGESQIEPSKVTNLGRR